MGNANKNPATQSFHIMRSHKDSDADRIINETKREQRKKAQEINGSCLTCKYTKAQIGIFLVCSKKDKKVRAYNYCESYSQCEGI